MDNKKPKLIVMGGPPRSGNFWIGRRITLHTKLAGNVISSISESKKQIDWDLKQFQYVNEDTYFIAPHSTFIIDTLIKKKEEGYNIIYIHLLRDPKNTAASYINWGITPKEAINTWIRFYKEIQKYPQFPTFKYEDFRDNHEQTMRKFFKYIDVEFEEVVIDKGIPADGENSKFENLTNEQKEIIENELKRSI